MSLDPIYYSDSISDIELVIIYSPLFNKYQVIFRKKGELYIPHESPLKANTWETLRQMIEAETRSDAFLLFGGVQIHKRLTQSVMASQSIFAGYP